jgi:ABC-2 type transport system permease protein
MIFLVYVGMLKYSGFAGAGTGVNDLFNQFPPAIKSILGLVDLDLTSIIGYYAVFYLYFMILAAIHAIMLGTVIISKEEGDKTADFLFVKPVLRSKIITAKLLATLINIIIFNLVTLLSSIVFIAMFNQGEPITTQILQLMIALFIIQLIFAAVGAGTGALTRKLKRATSISAAIVLVTFIISVAVDLYSKIDFLTYVTPFKYFPAVDIIKTGTYESSFLVLSFILIILFIGITYRFMEKRDINV